MEELQSCIYHPWFHSKPAWPSIQECRELFSCEFSWGNLRQSMHIQDVAVVYENTRHGWIGWRRAGLAILPPSCLSTAFLTTNTSQVKYSFVKLGSESNQSCPWFPHFHRGKCKEKPKARLKYLAGLPLCQPVYNTMTPSNQVSAGSQPWTSYCSSCQHPHAVARRVFQDSVKYLSDLYRYSKSLDRYSNMIILYISDEACSPAMPRAALISHF